MRTLIMCALPEDFQGNGDLDENMEPVITCDELMMVEEDNLLDDEFSAYTEMEESNVQVSSSRALVVAVSPRNDSAIESKASQEMDAKKMTRSVTRVLLPSEGLMKKTKNLRRGFLRLRGLNSGTAGGRHPKIHPTSIYEDNQLEL